MDDKCMVSIICTAYNHEKYIRQTLESFLNQKTNFRFEILVHDDASTDGTAEIIREMAETYPDVIFPTLQTENQYSKNPLITELLVPKASGKYIAICEGDDYWVDSDKLQLQVDWLEEHQDYSACVHNTTVLNCETGNTVLYNQNDHVDRDFLLDDVLYGVGHAYHTSAIVARHEYYSNLPDFFYISARHRVGDHPRAIWCAINGKIRYMSKAMSVYRQFSAPSSWSVRVREADYIENRLTGAIEMFKAVKKYVSDEEKKKVDNCILKYEWELLQAKGEYAQMKEPPYDALFKAASVKQRLWINFKLHCPRLFCLVMKLRGREGGIPDKLKNKYGLN